MGFFKWYSWVFNLPLTPVMARHHVKVSILIFYFLLVNVVSILFDLLTTIIGFKNKVTFWSEQSKAAFTVDRLLFGDHYTYCL